MWCTAEEMLKKEKYLSTGCPKLDSALRGGIAKRGITQIYGAAGSGKTQLALQLCLSVQISEIHGGCNSGAAYICTESFFPSGRLQQLLQSSQLVNRYGATSDRIFVEHVSTITDLENCLTERMPRLLKLEKIGLLIIDSIAAPFRSEYSNQELKIRAKTLRAIGQCLHNLCRNYELSTVCVNQVSAAVGSGQNSANVCNGDLPTLGVTWASLMTNSFCLVKNGDHRYIDIRESPYLPRKIIPFEITQSGVGGL